MKCLDGFERGEKSDSEKQIILRKERKKNKKKTLGDSF